MNVAELLFLYKMDIFTESPNTLKIIFGDGSSMFLPKWFTDQFSYFKDLIDDTGSAMEDKQKNEYKYLEINVNYTELGRLIDKPVLIFLKKFAYHYAFLHEDNLKNAMIWNKEDVFLNSLIQKYIQESKFDELFRIYVAADYLGNIQMCHIITDTFLKHLSINDLTHINEFKKIFDINSQFTPQEEEDILRAFKWED